MRLTRCMTRTFKLCCESPAGAVVFLLLCRPWRPATKPEFFRVVGFIGISSSVSLGALATGFRVRRLSSEPSPIAQFSVPARRRRSLRNSGYERDTRPRSSQDRPRAVREKHAAPRRIPEAPLACMVVGNVARRPTARRTSARCSLDLAVHHRWSAQLTAVALLRGDARVLPSFVEQAAPAGPGVPTE